MTMALVYELNFDQFCDGADKLSLEDLQTLENDINETWFEVFREDPTSDHNHKLEDMHNYVVALVDQKLGR